MRFLVERELSARTGAHQPEREHRAYWRRKSEQGVLLYAGRWADAPGDTLLLEVPDPAALQAVLTGDPYARDGGVTRTRVRRLGDLLPGQVVAPSRSHPVHVERGRPRPGRLTPHEARVAQMMLDGLTNRQLADRLGISQRAVEQHITRIYRKLSISRRAQLAVALHGAPQDPARTVAPAG
jgi:DNA-binding CsgD family transcriptional regulator/uncharacterized protein YciI